MDTRKTGQVIAYLRKKKNITQAHLAEILGISDKAVSKWERGLSIPDSSILNRLSVILDSDVTTILEGRVGCITAGWRGLLFLDSDIPASTKLGNETLLSVQICYFLLAGIKKIAIITKNTDYVNDFSDKVPEIGIDRKRKLIWRRKETYEKIIDAWYILCFMRND